MATYNWAAIVARLNKLIRYGCAPVGMKWVKTEEEFRQIPKVLFLNSHLGNSGKALSHLCRGWTGPSIWLDNRLQI